MADSIQAIIKTREKASQIIIKCLTNIEGLFELEIKNKILQEIEDHSELYPKGWYDPPPDGISILLDQDPFERLQYNTLRDKIWWPNTISKLRKETVGMVYISPLDHKTGMMGDIGFTFYTGIDEEVKKHIKECHDVILLIAEAAVVGMKFSDLYAAAEALLINRSKAIKWMTTTNDPTLGTNLGHIIPGSLGNTSNLGDNFDDVKNTITKNRIYINGFENFVIPPTCAFTIEARLVDIEKGYLPNIFFHFIVCFKEGERTILGNLEKIFKMFRMDYMES